MGSITSRLFTSLDSVIEAPLPRQEPKRTYSRAKPTTEGPR
jgi:hypothetical protein